ADATDRPADLRAPDRFAAVVVARLDCPNGPPLQVIGGRVPVRHAGVGARVVVEVGEVHVGAVSILIKPGHVTLNMRGVRPPEAEHTNHRGRRLGLDRLVAGLENGTVTCTPAAAAAATSASRPPKS